MAIAHKIDRFFLCAIASQDQELQNVPKFSLCHVLSHHHTNPTKKKAMSHRSNEKEMSISNQSFNSEESELLSFSCQSSSASSSSSDASLKPQYARALFKVRRHGIPDPNTKIHIVRTHDGVDVAFGSPTDWPSGIAAKVGRGELLVVEVPISQVTFHHQDGRNPSHADQSCNSSQHLNVEDFHESLHLHDFDLNNDNDDEDEGVATSRPCSPNIFLHDGSNAVCSESLEPVEDDACSDKQTRIGSNQSVSTASSSYRSWKDVSGKITPKFASAALSFWRRHPNEPQKIMVVRNRDGKDVDFGSPSEWQPGIASRVQSGELHVSILPFFKNDFNENM